MAGPPAAVPPAVESPGLTGVEDVLVRGVAAGVPVAALASRLDMSRSQAHRMLREPRLERALRDARRAVSESREFTRWDAHDMYMEAYSVGECSADMVKATDGLVKLHGLAPRAPSGPSVSVNVGDVAGGVSMVSVGDMTDDELRRLAAPRP